jgi:AcrR family transcriptional regulator
MNSDKHTLPENSRPSAGPHRRLDVAAVRKEQIIDAAVQIIAAQGLPHLSLSKIEDRTGMKRGQLTYYFPTKEHILLAVFDRLLAEMMRKMHELESMEETHGLRPIAESIREMLQKVLLGPDFGRDLRALEYTFLAETTFREEYRTKLASEYETWRRGMTVHYQISAKPGHRLAKQTDPRIIASFLMALVHGWNMQLAADPQAFDRTAMLEFSLQLLLPLFEEQGTTDGTREAIP